MAPAKKAAAKKAAAKVTAKKAATKTLAKKVAGKGRSTSAGVKTSAKTGAKSATSARKAPARATAAPARKAVAKANSTTANSTKPARANRAAAAKPVFDAKFLAAQHELLLAERATYLRQAESLQAEADSLAELREPGDVQFDEESGEGDTLAVERERDLALSARARHEIEEIDWALRKLEIGTYGICEVSGDPIPRARLQAIPQVRERVEYKVGGFNRR